MKSILTLLSVAALVSIGVAGGISGQVLDAVNGEPVVGAMVVARAEGGASAQARTNARGRYLIEDLRPGEYRVRAAGARGYEPAEFPRPVPVREGQVTEDIDFRLERVQNPNPGAISGRVVDRRTGEPIRGARVMAHGRHGRRVTRTNENGQYLLRGLIPGEYRVTAAARHYLRTEPRPVAVEPGQVVEDVDFALVPKPHKGAITGCVTDARTGEPVAGAIIVARGEHGAGRVATNRAGCYRLILPPGEYRVSARARGYQPAEFPRPVPVHPREVTRDVDFSLERTALSHD